MYDIVRLRERWNPERATFQFFQAAENFHYACAFWSAMNKLNCTKRRDYLAKYERDAAAGGNKNDWRILDCDKQFDSGNSPVIAYCPPQEIDW